jgi:hypothetical protein
MALEASFMLENYSQVAAKGTLTVYGGIIQDQRGPVGTFNGQTGQKISGYSIIDFKGSEADLELKSRPTINHDKWATAIIGCNKINDFRNNKKSHNYVCWLYQDGLYYIKVDLNNWNFTKGVQKVERDGKVEFSDCYYIPYQNLIKVE